MKDKSKLQKHSFQSSLPAILSHQQHEQNLEIVMSDAADKIVALLRQTQIFYTNDNSSILPQSIYKFIVSRVLYCVYG